MSELSTLEKWQVPSSMGLGVWYYYRNILRGSDYLNNLVRETFAWCDSRLTPALRSIYDEGQNARPHDRPVYGWNGVFHLLEGGGVDKVIIKQLDATLSHMAYRRGDAIDYLQLKEFFAYCGIDGIYDFENKRHFAVEPTIKVLPLTLLPEVWQKREDIDAARLEIASLMAPKGYLQEFDAEIEELTSSTWNEYGNVARAKIFEENILPDDAFQKAYIDAHPEMHAPLAKIEALKAAKLSRQAEMKEKFAPLGDAFKLPAVGTPYNLDWHNSFESIMGRQTEFKDRLMAYHKENLIKRSDPRFLKFSFDSVRERAFAMSDWALRDFNMSEVNRGVNGPMRRHDVPRNFVRAVLQEKEDGLLGILQTPHRIEFLDPEKKRFRLVFNNLEVETFTMDQVMALKAANDKEDAKLALEDSPLVRKYHIEPIPQVEKVPQKLEWEFPPELQHLVTMVDGFDDDEDLVEERQMQAFDADIDERLAELASKKEHEVNTVVPNQNPEAPESPSAPLAEEGTLTGEVNDLSSPAPSSLPSAPADEVSPVEASSDVPNTQDEPVLDAEPGIALDSPTSAEIGDVPVEKPAVETAADSVDPVLSDTSSAQAPDLEADAKSPVDDSENDILVQFDVARELNPASAAPTAAPAKPGNPELTADELAAKLQNLVDAHALFGMDEEELKTHLIEEHGVSEDTKIPPVSAKMRAEVDEWMKTGKIPEALKGSVISNNDPRVEKANAKHEEGVKRSEAEKERQRKFEEKQSERLKQMEQQRPMHPRGPGGGMPGMGMGGGMGGMGGMGMPGMRNNSHLPPTYNIDLGLSTLFGGLRRAGRATIEGVGSRVAGITVDVEQRAALLNTNADEIVAIRERLETGKNAAGEALTADELLQNWGGLKDAVQNIKTGLKGVARLPDGKITDDLVASLKHASKAVNDTKPLVDESAKKPGKVGEAAKEVQAAMNKIVEALMKLIKMLLSAFSKEKSAAPEL
jgi:hypothetical protein